jgi:hypothetical protein
VFTNIDPLAVEGLTRLGPARTEVTWLKPWPFDCVAELLISFDSPIDYLIYLMTRVREVLGGSRFLFLVIVKHALHGPLILHDSQCSYQVITLSL